MPVSASLIAGMAIWHCGTSTSAERVPMRRKPMSRMTPSCGFWKCGVIFER